PDTASGSRFPISWSPTSHRRTLPSFHGALELTPDGHDCSVRISGSYAPPLGLAGTVVDALAGHHVAEHSIADLAAYVAVRLAVIDRCHPRIFPVNYAIDGETIVLRTAEGTTLTCGTRDPVCFEIDHYDPSAREGWSVVVDGTLEEVTRLSAPGGVRSAMES